MKNSETPATQLLPLEISDDPERQQCFLLYISGWTPAEIEGKTGIRQDKIRQWNCRGKWSEQKKQLEEMRREKNPPMEQPIVKAVINSRRGEHKKKFIEHTGEMAEADAKHWNSLSPDERLVVATNISSLNGVHRKNLGLEDEEEAGNKGHINLTFLSQASEPGMVRVIDSTAVRVIEEPVREAAEQVSTNPDDY